ncbi:hypothetical protein [Cupriavidus sp. H18C1]|uniref:hypothetical protein n=1 Tax=Cupriavidus sp. H18C1 TaxID=3241601 RepID=UPI003BB8F02C
MWLDGGRQFGVLCTPGDGGDATGTAVLFPNTGGNHHVGDCRLFVTLSRQLAHAGVAALRLDVSALGDSPLAARTMRIAALYGEQPWRDVAAAAAWLKARGYRRVVVAGICSGGFVALQAALAAAPIDGLVLANLLKFRWDSRDGGKGANADAEAESEADVDAEPQSTRVYLAAARNPAQWLRLLRGEIDPWPHAAALARRLFARRAGADPGARDLDAYAREAMHDLQRRGVRVDLLYGAGGYRPGGSAGALRPASGGAGPAERHSRPCAAAAGPFAVSRGEPRAIRGLPDAASGGVQCAGGSGIEVFAGRVVGRLVGGLVGGLVGHSGGGIVGNLAGYPVGDLAAARAALKALDWRSAIVRSQRRPTVHQRAGGVVSSRLASSLASRISCLRSCLAAFTSCLYSCRASDLRARYSPRASARAMRRSTSGSSFGWSW